MPRFSKRQRGNGRGRAISTPSNATSSVGQAALTPRAVSTPRTRGRSEKRGGNGRGRAFSTSSNATFRWSGCFNTSSRFNTLYTWPFQEETSRTSFPLCATESSQTFPLTEADIPRIVDAVINGLQVGTQDNVALQSDDDGLTLKCMVSSN